MSLERDKASYLVDAFGDQHIPGVFTETGALFHPLQDKPTFGVLLG